MFENAITTELIKQLNTDLTDISSIDVIVSFIQESGFREIEDLLDKASDLDIPVRIITSTYLSITDPTALSLLYFTPKNIEVYIYSGSAPSFHSKAYFFYGKNIEQSKVFIGSSNLSRTALNKGIEWNYRVDGWNDSEAILRYKSEFNYILSTDTVKLDKDVLKDYASSYRANKEALEGVQRSYYKPNNKANNKVLKVANKTSTYGQEKVENLFKPNSAQIEALLELKNTRQEGNEKALVVAATGVGKTFLAAFDSMEYKTVLFVAHREEILNQAYETFAKVRGAEGLGRLFGQFKEHDAKILFASIQSLSREENLKQFNRKKFDYICVDELHHGVAGTYKKVLDYFEPDFMLGLTATPHRLDQKDVYAICDYNSVYEVDLFTSINRGWLVPYRYYGIYDATVNYENIKFLNGKYVEKDLEKALLINERSELILKHYLRYRRSRALAFCRNIKHAEYMAAYFNENGIKSVCIHSDSSTENYIDRKEGIRKLEDGYIEVIFSVDMLNEGVDIPSLDMLLFLRPTESPVVFLQQMGRGLRRFQGKQDVRIIDFIGNFKKVDLIPFLLGNNRRYSKGMAKNLQDGQGLPMGCLVDFEFEVVDLIEKVMKSRMKIGQQIDGWYLQCKEELASYTLPNRMDFFSWLSDEQYQLVKKQKKTNVFKDFIRYQLNREDDIVESDFFESDEYRFINFIENTSMSQLYKVPVVLSFIMDNYICQQVTIDTIIDQFVEFYSNNRNRMDIVRRKTIGEPSELSRDRWKQIILSNPVHFLGKTHGDIFELVDEAFRIKLEFSWCRDDEIRNKWFVGQVKDALMFRRNEFLDLRIERQ